MPLCRYGALSSKSLSPGVLKRESVLGSRLASEQSVVGGGHRRLKSAAWGLGISGFAKTFHMPKSARLGSSFEGGERKVPRAVGWAAEAGR